MFRKLIALCLFLPISLFAQPTLVWTSPMYDHPVFEFPFNRNETQFRFVWREENAIVISQSHFDTTTSVRIPLRHAEHILYNELECVHVMNDTVNGILIKNVYDTLLTQSYRIVSMRDGSTVFQSFRFSNQIYFLLTKDISGDGYPDFMDVFYNGANQDQQFPVFSNALNGQELYNFNYDPRHVVVFVDVRDVDHDGLHEILTRIGNVYYSTPTNGFEPLSIEGECDRISPSNFHLTQNYPNPFNSTTTITFSLARPSRAILEIYNNIGQIVHTVNYGIQPLGTFTYNWTTNHQVGNGVYFYRIKTDNAVSNTKKMVVLK